MRRPAVAGGWSGWSRETLDVLGGGQGDRTSRGTRECTADTGWRSGSGGRATGVAGEVRMTAERPESHQNYLELLWWQQMFRPHRYLH